MAVLSAGVRDVRYVRVSLARCLPIAPSFSSSRTKRCCERSAATRSILLHDSSLFLLILFTLFA